MNPLPTTARPHRRRLLGGIAGVLAACTAAAVAAPAATGMETAWHVSPHGDDTHPGTADRPFATLERARDAARESANTRPGAANGRTILLASGIHRRAQPLDLDGRDDGLTIRGPADRSARVNAGRPIPPTALQPVTDAAIRSRLDASARDHVVVCDIVPLGGTARRPADVYGDGGGLPELLVGDEWQPLSRWPNDGDATIERVLDRGLREGPRADWRGGTFVAREDAPGRWRPARWHVEEGVWLEGYWRVPWFPDVVRVRAIDPAARTITLAAPVPGGIGSKYAPKGALGDGKEPWCAVNLLEEIDRPGEWCLHVPGGRLYFWPPRPLGATPGDAVTLVDRTFPLIRIRGGRGVRIASLTVEGGLGNGIEIEGGAGNAVDGCLLRLLGGTGATIAGGTDNGVVGCDIHSLGGAGISLAGGERATLTPCRNVAVDNDVSTVGRRRKTWAAAIHVGSPVGQFDRGEAVGCRVARNLLHDLPHAAVLYEGNDNLLEGNEVCRVALTSGDVGAFYTRQDWTSQGNVLRRNYVHDCPRANAFYVDDGDSGDTIEDNVVVRCGCGPFLGGGHDNTVRRNLVVDCPVGIHFDTRGVARGYATHPGYRRRLESSRPAEPPWSDRYPSLARLLDPALDAAGVIGAPHGNVVTGNVVVGCERPLRVSGKPAELRDNTVADNLELSDARPLFRDEEAGDLRLDPASPVRRALPSFPQLDPGSFGLERGRGGAAAAGGGPSPAAGRPAAPRFDSATDLEATNDAAGRPAPRPAAAPR